jgi:hypothetical protein
LVRGQQAAIIEQATPTNRWDWEISLAYDEGRKGSYVQPELQHWSRC